MRMLQCEFFPITVLLVDDEKEFLKLTRKVAPPGPTFPPPGAASTISFGTTQSATIAMVVLGETDELEDEEVESILTHEAVHVKQFLFESIGEEHVGVETEAYAVQYFSDYLIREWTYRQNRRAKKNEQR